MSPFRYDDRRRRGVVQGGGRRGLRYLAYSLFYRWRRWRTR